MELLFLVFLVFSVASLEETAVMGNKLTYLVRWTHRLLSLAPCRAGGRAPDGLAGADSVAFPSSKVLLGPLPVVSFSPSGCRSGDSVDGEEAAGFGSEDLDSMPARRLVLRRFHLPCPFSIHSCGKIGKVNKSSGLETISGICALILFHAKDSGAGVQDKLSMGKFEHGNLLVSLSEGHRHGYSLAAVAVGLGIGVAGLCKALHSSLVIPWVSWKFFSESERVYYAGGLKNLGNNCFLNVILQALASCDRFVSSLDDLLGSDGLLPEEQPERMPLIFALSSLLKDLSIVRDERTVLNPQRVMHALSFYVSHFNLTRQQDASEAFLHLLTSLRDEFSRCYVPYRSSLADITVFHSKVYKQREGNQPECKRWKQNIFGPFDGTIGSTLSCRNCSSVLSLDFENFHCLPLSPVPDINGDIINGCSLVDCLKHFTVLEHLDNYRCDRCWHNAAAKYFSLTSEVDEEKVNKLRSCVDYDSCSCRHIFGPEEIKWSVSSKATKQLAITHCPKILCIHLLRASISLHGELVKREGHISFPLLLNLSPFAGGAFSTGQGPGPSATNMQRHDQPSLHLYRQNVQMAVNMFPTGGESSSQLRKDEATNGYGYSLYKANVDVARSSLSSSSSLSRNKLYSLSAVVEHYGVCGGGHYAAYRRVTPNCDANHLVRSLGEQWLYISDDHVSQVSEGDVLGAEATLLFYERL